MPGKQPGSPSLNGSPSLLAPDSRAKACKHSPVSSPSAPSSSAANPPPIELPGALTSGMDSVAIGAGKVPVQAPVPEAPPTFQRVSLVGDASGIGAHEAYSRDEQQLNNFLKLHPSTFGTCSRTRNPDTPEALPRALLTPCFLTFSG